MRGVRTEELVREISFKGVPRQRAHPTHTGGVHELSHFAKRECVGCAQGLPLCVSWRVSGDVNGS